MTRTMIYINSLYELTKKGMHLFKSLEKTKEQGIVKRIQTDSLSTIICPDVAIKEVEGGHLPFGNGPIKRPAKLSTPDCFHSKTVQTGRIELRFSFCCK